MTTNRARRRGGRERGAAAVEFALICPLFMAIVFGICEYGWIFYQQFNLAAAVRDGLRQGVTVSQTDNPGPMQIAISGATADLKTMGISPSAVTLTTQYNGSSPTRTMTLTANMRYHPLVGMVPTPQNLKYSMTMMLELQ